MGFPPVQEQFLEKAAGGFDAAAALDLDGTMPRPGSPQESLMIGSMRTKGLMTGDEDVSAHSAVQIWLNGAEDNVANSEKKKRREFTELLQQLDQINAQIEALNEQIAGMTERLNELDREMRDIHLRMLEREALLDDLKDGKLDDPRHRAQFEAWQRQNPDGTLDDYMVVVQGQQQQDQATYNDKADERENVYRERENLIRDRDQMQEVANQMEAARTPAEASAALGAYRVLRETEQHRSAAGLDDAAKGATDIADGFTEAERQVMERGRQQEADQQEQPSVEASGLSSGLGVGAPLSLDGLGDDVAHADTPLTAPSLGNDGPVSLNGLGAGGISLAGLSDGKTDEPSALRSEFERQAAAGDPPTETAPDATVDLAGLGAPAGNKNNLLNGLG